MPVSVNHDISSVNIPAYAVNLLGTMSGAKGELPNIASCPKFGTCDGIFCQNAKLAAGGANQFVAFLSGAG